MRVKNIDIYFYQWVDQKIVSTLLIDSLELYKKSGSFKSSYALFFIKVERKIKIKWMTSLNGMKLNASR